MAPARKLMTLTEVSEATGISMATLQRYKRNYQERIPSVGEGRKQRYPKKALPVFEKIRQENLKKRGRPAKGATDSKRKTGGRGGSGAAKSGSGSRKAELLTLLEIGRRTGISYPTLLRYVKLHLDEIPHVGAGRKRRYPAEAVKVFRRLRLASKRGPRAGGRTGGGRRASGTPQALGKRVRELEKAQRQLTRQLDDILKLLKKPLHLTVRSD